MKFGFALIAVAAATVAAGSVPANAGTKLVISGNFAAQTAVLGSPYTVNYNYDPAGYIFVQSWAFGTNNVSVGGWLNFNPGWESLWFNQASNLPTPYGNYFVYTDRPWYSISPNPAPNQPSGLKFINGSYALSDGGTLTVGPVPEASTWVMLLSGFGLIGVTARRRKASVAV